MRHQLASRLKEITSNFNGIVFLAVGDKGEDPSDEFLKRFADVKASFRKESSVLGPTQENPVRNVVDKVTGEQECAMGAGKIKWVSDTEVEVDGYFVRGSLNGQGYKFFLKRDKSGWKVTEERPTWVS